MPKRSHTSEIRTAWIVAVAAVVLVVIEIIRLLRELLWQRSSTSGTSM